MRRATTVAAVPVRKRGRSQAIEEDDGDGLEAALDPVAAEELAKQKR
jgi:hypothetical protein